MFDLYHQLCKKNKIACQQTHSRNALVPSSLLKNYKIVYVLLCQIDIDVNQTAYLKKSRLLFILIIRNFCVSKLFS